MSHRSRRCRTLQQPRRRARLALGVPAGATVVGAVGRLTYQKAPEDFMAALVELGRRDVIGVWIGGGNLLSGWPAWPSPRGGST